ncbi:39S ribosomal protein L47, mitochondrial [Trichoplax sp. H2]|uniref:Large ribosomal subunit protein uL29m n=1 Tax=Trichoplax adhaerens TaxID=10228 RepID=B3RZE3_TRIAD|nr:hypothetical protein TRIADDRAFT_57420 [Trichoplax adhaerens]EDV23829.1 hypothetical protein TRIADDRAFT_57420 [Trichoplax adhaerens]RDD42444.1 39S ribosomal protein L47, mitochondrial [Trichoplax sp. H2]|eukprot:XP_002113355.1 hypothetical protein TRIADDRAFT_57420 [Trichoplax adhaerens]
MSTLLRRIRSIALNTVNQLVPFARNRSCPGIVAVQQRSISCSLSCQGLKEFLPQKGDLPDEDGKLIIGRSWRASELRVKSFEDLLKLWYVLLKEKNMLLTLQHEARRQRVPMPGPERLIKVNKSMARIRHVLRERETAREKIRPASKKSN